MLIRPDRLAATLLLALCASAGSATAQMPVAAPAIDSLEIRAHTRFLADDELAGRGTGTQGERLAAAYIASQLERLGLQSLDGDTSYMLPLPLREARIADSSSVTIITTAGRTRHPNVADFIVNTGGAGAFRSFEGRAVFLGQPVHAAGRVSAALDGAVAVFLGPLGGSAVELVPALIDAGVTGIVLLVPDPAQYDLYVRSRGATRFFVDATVDDPVWQPSLPVLIAGPRMSEALLAGVTVPPSLVQGDTGPAFDLGHTL